MATVLFPIPRQDFDPTEVAISWKVLTSLGHTVQFSTPDGTPGEADEIMLDGVGLDPWGLVPGLRRARIIGMILRANADGRRAYSEMMHNAEFKRPRRWEELAVDDFDAILLAGGHRARGMREYLESTSLQSLVSDFFARDKPVAAICHGVLLAARSRTASGHSVLYGRRTTALTWQQERTADAFARFGRPWDPSYYRTYLEKAGQPRGYMSVEQEVIRALKSSEDFVDVRRNDPDHRRKTMGLYRDTAHDARAALVVIDQNYVSARWPGDTHAFAQAFAEILA